MRPLPPSLQRRRRCPQYIFGICPMYAKAGRRIAWAQGGGRQGVKYEEDPPDTYKERKESSI